MQKKVLKVVGLSVIALGVSACTDRDQASTAPAKDQVAAQASQAPPPQTPVESTPPPGGGPMGGGMAPMGPMGGMGGMGGPGGRPPPTDIFVTEDADDYDPGVETGDTFPAIKALHNGEEITSVEPFLRDKGMIFIANRSASW